MDERGTFRPGGFELTGRMLALCAFKSGARLLDAGCGSGATVLYLRESLGMDAQGIDIAYHPDSIGEGPLRRGDAAHVAEMYCTHSLDGILCECSFSLFENAALVLQGFHRALKPGGYLLVSELYSRTKAAVLKGMANRLDTRDDITKRLEDAGFALELFEDHSPLLREMAANMVFADGAQSLYDGIGSSFEEMKRIRCGYYLLVARAG